MNDPTLIETVDGPVPKVLAPVVEKRVRNKAQELREQIVKLAMKIEVSNFRIEPSDGLDRVVWDVHVPPTLITLANQLVATLSPNDG